MVPNEAAAGAISGRAIIGMVSSALIFPNGCRLTPESSGRHQFGGPSLLLSYGDRVWRVHRILTIDCSDEVLNCASYSGPLPLIFPIGYPGSSIVYAVGNDGDVRVLHLHSSQWILGWPADGYPSDLPIYSVQAIQIRRGFLRYISARDWWERPASLGLREEGWPLRCVFGGVEGPYLWGCAPGPTRVHR